MLPAYFLLSLLFPADGRQVASVDLSEVPKDQPSTSTTESVRGGRVFTPSGGWTPAHVPISLSVKLLNFAESSNPAPWSSALEVAVTNIGEVPVWIPAGTDTTKILAASAKGRRYLALSVWTLGDDKRKVNAIGGGMPVSNADEPKSQVQLAPGDYVVYKIGLDRRAQAVSACIQKASVDGCQITVVASLHQKIVEGGVDYSETISDDIEAVNSLKWSLPRP